MTETGVSYYPREVINPPQKEYPLVEFADSIEALDRSELTPGSKRLALGLLFHGGVVEFPGGIGLDYNKVFKYGYDPYLTEPAIREIAEQFSGKVNGIVCPDYSAIAPAVQLAAEMGMPLVRIRKDGNNHNGSFVVEIDSYTNEKRDTLGIDPGLFGLFDEEEVDLLFMDEIIDTGKMAAAVEGLIEQGREAGLQVNLSGVAALMEKTYTGAGENIRETTGFYPYGVLKIEDLGFNPCQWVKIKGIDEGLVFKDE